MMHLIKIIVNTELIIQCKTEENNIFKTVLVVLHEVLVVLSATEFTLYLSRTLQKNDHNCKKATVANTPETLSISKHNPHKYKDEHFHMYSEYADNISVITTDKNKTDHIKKPFVQTLKLSTFTQTNKKLLNMKSINCKN